MIIANEKKFIEQIIDDRQKPKTMSVKNLIRHLARYYYDYCKDMPLDEYKRFILDAVKSFKLSPLEYQEYKYAAYVRRYCKNLMDEVFSHDLREVESVSFTQAEMDIVNQAVYRKERKVLFTLYALAKIYSPTTGWVNNSEFDIFKAANVDASHKEKIQILHSLYKNGLIQVNHMLDKNGYQVELEPDSPTVFSTSTLKNFGNQYLVLTNSSLKMCPECGRAFKPKQNTDCYCHKCRRSL